MSAPSVIPSDIGLFLDYCPETGIFRRKGTGAVTGNPYADGYIRIIFRKKTYAAHRVAWFLVMGQQPQATIDHKNLDRSDNRWVNLRPATQSENNCNRRAAGQWGKGVTLHKDGRFQAQIGLDGKNHYLGLFDTPEDASAAYSAAAADLHGQFARVA